MIHLQTVSVVVSFVFFFRSPSHYLCYKTHCCTPIRYFHRRWLNKKEMTKFVRIFLWIHWVDKIHFEIKINHIPLVMITKIPQIPIGQMHWNLRCIHRWSMNWLSLPLTEFSIRLEFSFYTGKSTPGIHCKQICLFIEIIEISSRFRSPFLILAMTPLEKSFLTPDLAWKNLKNELLTILRRISQ